METVTNVRPCWAIVVDIGIADEVWVELESGSIVPIDAPGDVIGMLEEGLSVLVDVDASGRAVPWSTVVVTRSELDRPPGRSGVAKAEPVADHSRGRHLHDAGLGSDLSDPLRTGVAAA
jgi:hypothetical protein